MWTIQLPLRVPVSKSKVFYLNLNQYRNAHFQVLDKAKKAFDREVRPRLAGIPKLTKLTLEYILYPGTAQLCDTNNILSIEDKFFSDSLVNAGVLEDDNYKFIADSKFRFGHIDRENPRVDVIVRSPDHIPLVRVEPLTEERESKPMKIITLITLTQMDLNAALAEYVGKLVPVAPDADLVLQKQDDGTYQIRLESASGAVSSVPVAPVADAPKHRGRAPKAEPKAAMAALKDVQTTQAQTPQPEAKNAPEASQEPSSEAPVASEESKPATPVKSLFVKPADINPANLTAEAHVEQTPVAEEKPTEEPTEEPPPAAPKGPSLFASFKRPNNG